MTALKWWLRIVGTLYLIEGIGIALMALTTPDAYAALWASTTAGALDALAVRGTLIAGMPGTLTWVLLGALLWRYSFKPAASRLLVIVVALWELLVWTPTDVLGVLNGFEVGRAATLIAIHVAIGASGLVLLRRSATLTASAAVSA